MTLPAQELEWGDPPPAKSGLKWRAVALELRARPGEWAKVGIFNPNTATGSVYRGLREAGCEVTTRVVVTGRQTAVWARWPA